MLAILAAAGLAGFALLRYGLPQYYFGWYPAIPVFFAVTGLLLLVWAVRARRENPGRFTITYLGMRSLKLVLTIIAILLYFGFVREQMMPFAITAFVFYEISFVVEIMQLRGHSEKANKITE